ncbi:glycoside hydrolase family 43 protein [Pedobacter endophyticus]|uniref:Family 43 glycosylhydrolase n=1 Tax=Pedobacter endophyticus TaxID=2789740 RepID=A0A7S9L0X5_9SPHI|nr:glycoside hydrolase family 43 protein [Pedobacter endophyticus]QPH40465.1 family 43 glycosylhydrolase [Pedobacter endophyticus]
MLTRCGLSPATLGSVSIDALRNSTVCLVASLTLLSCGINRTQTTSSDDVPIGSALVNPALPGDNPDPSIIRVGKVYYATSTTNEWAPYFTIYKSTDLKNWKLINHVFPNGFKDMKNQWGENNFWASELVYDAKQNRIYAYYTAHNRETKGNPGLQCGIAWVDADKIETDKFTDNGPVIIEDECGAIDAFELQHNGKIYAFWKNDGNGCGKESWIWKQEINESRTKLLGQKTKMFTNSQPWETGLVEGACFFTLGEYVYSLYSVGGCCDANCNYKTGIARTKDLASGVWEKYGNNPIMASNDKWNCPGHGTVVKSADDRLFMLYHAFNKDYDVFVGREGVIEELTIGADGWPVLHNATVPNRAKSDLNFTDDFEQDTKLNLVWQWPSKSERPQMSFENGLNLAASDQNHGLGTFLGQYIKTVNFNIEANVNVNETNAGICLGGAIFKSKWPGELGGIGITASNDGLAVFDNFEGTYTVLKDLKISLSKTVQLRMQIADNGKQIEFFYKNDGEKWVSLYRTPFNAAKYVPWGMGYRAGIVVKGNAPQKGSFKSFRIANY